MIQDLHSHTYYSFCGKDLPEKVIETAINGGIEHPLALLYNLIATKNPQESEIIIQQ